MSKRFKLLSIVAACSLCITASAQGIAQQQGSGKFEMPRNNYFSSQKALSFDGQYSQKGIPVVKGEARNMRHIERNSQEAGNWVPRVTAKRAAIIEPEAGEHAYYRRSGMAYYYSSDYIYQTSQTGHVEIVETSDGTIYVKDIISHLEAGTWVKGTKSGNTITIPTDQEVAYYAEADVTFTLNWVDSQNSGGNLSFTKSDESTITFTIDGDVISLVGSSSSHFIGVCYEYEGGNYFDGEGDWDTMWMLHEGYVPASTDLVTPPADMTSETWYSAMTTLYGDLYNGKVKIGFSGNEIYIQGISSIFPDSWIMGTIDGNTVTFESMQYQGSYWDRNMWIAGGRKDASEISPIFTMTYDATNNILTLDDEYNLFLNASEDNLYYQQGYSAVVITLENPSELPVATGDPIDELPYVNSFDTEADFNQFGIIDYNRDNYTWKAVTWDGRYECNNGYGSVIADDWLVSPAIKLEAGKYYRHSIDVCGIASNYTERVEVKMGKEPSASAMTISVLPPTEFTYMRNTTLEQESFTVSETGYYHFGIHCISEYGYMMYVDNFVVDLGLDPKAPEAVTNLSVIPYTEKAGATISFTAPKKAIDGSDLTGSLNVNVLVDGVVSKTYENIAPGSDNSVEFEDPNVGVGTHTFMLIAGNEAGNGKKGESVTVTLKCVIEPPYTADLTKMETMELFTIIDANEDNYTWFYESWYGTTSYRNNYDGVTPANDYLVTLPIHLVDGRYYSVVVNAYANYMTERFEVVVGKEATPEGLNITAIEPTEVKAVSPMTAKDYEGLFMVPEEGQYFLAIHVISDADQSQFCVNTLTIEKSLMPTSPAAPDLTVTPAEQGVLSALVDITAPTKCYNGEPLGDNFSKVELYRDGSLIATITKEQFDAAAPNAYRYIDDQVPTNGVHSYQAIPYDKIGDPGKKTEPVEAFIGTDVPDFAKNIEAFDNETSIRLTWDAVTTGKNGQYVNPADISYNIWTVQVLYGSYYVLQDLIGNTNETSFDVTYDTNSGTQRVEYWAVQPVNSAGTGDAYLAQMLVGAPYELPFEEHFINNQVTNMWVYNNNIEFWIAATASDGDGNAVKFTSIDGSLPSQFATGKLNVKDASYPVLVIDARTESPDSRLDIVGIVNGREEVTLAENIPLTAEFSTVSVPLESVKDSRYIQAELNMTFPRATSYGYEYPYGYVFDWGDSIVVDNLHIVDLPLPTNVMKTIYNGQATVVWTAPATTESIQSYCIYVNGELFDVVDGETTSYTFSVEGIEGDVNVAVSAFYSYNVETPAVEAVQSDPIAIEEMIADGKPFDIYDVSGRLIRQQTKSLSGLNGLYIIKSDERVSRVVVR